MMRAGPLRRQRAGFQPARPGGVGAERPKSPPPKKSPQDPIPSGRVSVTSSPPPLRFAAAIRWVSFVLNLARNAYYRRPFTDFTPPLLQHRPRCNIVILASERRFVFRPLRPPSLSLGSSEPPSVPGPKDPAAPADPLSVDPPLASGHPATPRAPCSPRAPPLSSLPARRLPPSTLTLLPRSPRCPSPSFAALAAPTVSPSA